MVAESSNQSASELNQGCSAADLELLAAWLRPLQTALTLEADRGFGDLQGRQERFHNFLVRQLGEPPPIALPADSRARLQDFVVSYRDYPGLTEASRRRLVTITRQWLHGLRQR